MKEKFLEAIKKARELSKKRNFVQSFEMAINLQGINPKTFMLNDVFELPHGRGKEVKVCAVGTGDFILKAKGVADFVIDAKKDFEKFKTKKDIKKFVKDIDFFVVEAPVMAEFAKVFGKVLGPLCKMPLPQHILPPGRDPTEVIKRLKRSVRIRGKKSPVIHTVFGTETQKDEELAENAAAIYEYILSKLERGRHNVKNIFIKLTMGPAVMVNGK